MESKLKIYSFPVIALFAILLVLSIVFYQERMLFTDASLIMFFHINQSGFHIQEGRIGSFISQLFPFIGVKLNLSLKYLMIFYSGGFNLFYLTVVSVLVFRLRQYSLAILMAFYFTLFFSDSFYWTNNEVHQGIAWLMLFLGLNHYVASKKTPFILSLFFFIGSMSFAIWTHPLLMLTTFFLWVFIRYSDGTTPYTKFQFYINSLIILILSYIKYKASRQHGYDSAKLDYISGLKFKIIFNLFNTKQWHFFVSNCLTNYWIFVILFILGITMLIINKKYFLAILTFSYVFIYIFLVCIVFPDADTNKFYFESEYSPLAIIAGAPVVYYLMPKLNEKFALMFIIFIFGIRLIYIINSSTLFSNRVKIITAINAKMKEKNLMKVIITETSSNLNKAYVMNWCAPIESLYFSKLQNESPQRTFVFANVNEINELKNTNQKIFIGCWQKIENKNLNKNYFNIDTTQQYQVMSYETLMSK